MKAIHIDAKARKVTEVETDGSEASLRILLGITFGPLSRATLEVRRISDTTKTRTGGEIVAATNVEEVREVVILLGARMPIFGNVVLLDSGLTVADVLSSTRFTDRGALQGLVDGISALKDTLGKAVVSGAAGTPAPVTPAKTVPADIDAKITGESRAMLDILSDELGRRGKHGR